MARLIDADRLREYYNVTDPAGTFAYCDAILRCIDNEPTVDAIPVEWLRNLCTIAKMETDDKMFIDWLIQTWREEQEEKDG